MVLNECSDMNIEDRLLLCIRQGDNDEAKKILQDLNSSDIIDGLGNTLLHFSSEYGNTVMTKYLIDTGCNVDAVNNHGNTPLILASQQDHKDVVRVLLEANSSVLISNNQGENAAKFILREKKVRFDILDLFLGKFKEECSYDNLRIAEELHKAKCTLPRAVTLKDTVITKYLLENGCNVNDPDEGFWGNTPIHEAVRCSDMENIALLIHSGADLNAEDRCGRRPLYYVESKIILKTLLDHGAQLITDDGTLVTDRHFKWDKETVEMLMQYELDFSAKEKEFGHTILHTLVLNEHFNPIEILKEKIDDSFDINVTNCQGFTPLIYASTTSNPDVVEFLLQKGADVNMVEMAGNSALTYALIPYENKTVQKARIKIMMLLLQHGANIQLINNYQHTLFVNVLFYNTFELAKFIIAHLALMEVLGGKIEDLIRIKIDSHTMFKNHYNLCKTRIEKMQLTMICESISLFKLFMANESEIDDFAHNKKLTSKLQSMTHYKHGFQLYYYQNLRKNIVKIVKQAADGN